MRKKLGGTKEPFWPLSRRNWEDNLLPFVVWHNFLLLLLYTAPSPLCVLSAQLTWKPAARNSKCGSQGPPPPFLICVSLFLLPFFFCGLLKAKKRKRGKGGKLLGAGKQFFALKFYFWPGAFYICFSARKTGFNGARRMWMQGVLLLLSYVEAEKESARHSLIILAQEKC